MDDQLKEFFLEAKSICLQASERVGVRDKLTNFLRHESVSAGEDQRHQVQMQRNITSQAKREVHGLQSQEKTAVRDRLHAYMRQVPVRESEPFIERASSTVASFFHAFVPRLALSAFVLFVLGGSAAYAAQGTLPGDALYPLKVNVYEPAVSRLAITAHAKASWDSDLALRRLEEAEQLAAQSALTDDALIEIERRFERHMDTARVNIEQLASDNAHRAATLGAELESSLQAHGTIIGMLDDDGSLDDGVSRLLVGVERAGSDIAEVTMQAEIRSGVSDDEQSLRDSAQRRMQHSLENVRKLRLHIEQDGSTNERSLERLGQAENLLMQASERLQQGSAAEALELSRSAIRVTHEGKLFFATDEAASSSVASSATSSSSSQSSSAASSQQSASVILPVIDDTDDDEEDDDDDLNLEVPELGDEELRQPETDADIDIKFPF